MKRYWELARNRIDGMSLRERAIIFLAAAFVVIALIDKFLLEASLAKQKTLSAQVVQQQEKMKELQAQIQALLQARSDDERSPLRARLAQLKLQLQEQDGYLQSRSERLVEPDKMAGLLEQVLNKNDRLQLIELKTLPASPLIEKPKTAAAQSPDAEPQAGENQPDPQKQIFKHGIRITVRGGYLDMLRYLAALEELPSRMFWGEVALSVEKYPDAVLTLTLYTLSLDKTWLTV
ncbi:MAG: agglutinin biogenesis protein [Gallionellales bacterium RIFCSPLOWO2_12_FULL_59_22]|nr:MAG: agglutinin biogenesis protein [Gallionellales bacterium RIFCSPLOWO2_02_FULL_59_110]OGT03248.1 MAG: agglutinin biogenesis protein [Gallionellales bacterium RIFCSPLOWO2_02_58_13]OGT13988.1 MAG: agglutinin biogenesis protein [Gallionellales bacterium RIFCSPLOWO2_12_FULL_59_22]